jgi:ATP-dependent Lon protease
MSPQSAKTSQTPPEEEGVAESTAPAVEIAPPAAKPRASRSTRTKKSATRKPPHILLPVLVVDETLLLPHMSIPFPIEDEESARVIDRATRSESRYVLVLTERPIYPESESNVPNGAADEDGELRALLADAIIEAAAQGGINGEPEWIPDPEPEPQEFELCGVGVIAEIAQFRPSGNRHIVLQGIARGIVTELVQQEPYLVARVIRHDDPIDSTDEAEAAMATVMEQVESYISMLPNVPEEVLTMVRGVEEPGWLSDLIAFSPEFTSDQRQELLEILDPIQRLRRLSVLIQKRLDVLNLRQQIQTEAQAGMDKQQREYYLREQLRAIQKELGESGSEAAVASELREKIDAAGMPEEVKAKALIQVERLEQQHPFSPEIGVIRGYLDWLIELPWSVETEDHLDLVEAARILGEDHYGLEKVKERILEFIAVRKLAGDKLRAPILCFVGPPGVGKTSLGRSIARAIGRNYVRMSLGGVRDEAEIRGHRRTYVGAMPGRVIKALKDAKSRNPVLVLDEVDKVGSDAFRGDPSSALLEVLDPEQNTTFSDHYLEVPFDLSKVIFITTANLLEPIPPALRDRMEIIEVSGYTEVEKMAIGRQFLIARATGRAACRHR